MTAFNVQHNSDMNVTPFVDVMMVLLIIFMVAIPAATSTMKLQIPPAEASSAPQTPTIVTVQQDGRLFVGDRAASIANLPQVVAQVLAVPRPTAQRVYLRAERGVRYGELMRVMNRLYATGYHQVALVSENL